VENLSKKALQPNVFLLVLFLIYNLSRTHAHAHTKEKKKIKKGIEYKSKEYWLVFLFSFIRLFILWYGDFRLVSSLAFWVWGLKFDP